YVENRLETKSANGLGRRHVSRNALLSRVTWQEEERVYPTLLYKIQQEKKVLVRTKLIWMGLKDNNHQFFEYLLSFTFPQHMVPDEVKKLCLLLLCIVQVCRIHPVFGHVDNFSKEFKNLVKASGVYAYLEPSMDSLKKIVVFLYPRLL
ncbi:hypothetical protein HID58_056274, partial [Brassica napus]